MIDDPNDHIMQAASHDLLTRINYLKERRRVIDRALLHEIKEAITDHRTHCRLQGINFPPLVPLLLPRLGRIAMMREDSDPADIRRVVVKLARDNPTITAEDIATALKHAFPNLKGLRDEMVDQGEAVAAETNRQIDEIVEKLIPAGNA